MPIDSPTALVEKLKKSGEFDRLRQELLAKFQQDESYPEFKEGLEDIARKRLMNEPMLHYLGPDWVLKELSQEIQRYPIVERAVANVRTFSDPAFLASLQKSMQNVLHEEKGGKSLAAVTSNDEPESEMTRIQLLESNVHQPEKAAHAAQQGDTHLENKLPRVTGSNASPLDSPLPMDLSKSPSTQNLTSTAYPTTPNQEDNIKRDGPSAPTNHQSIDMISEPSSSAISAQISNVNKTIEDQHQTTDIEMADIRAAH